MITKKDIGFAYEKLPEGKTKIDGMLTFNPEISYSEAVYVISARKKIESEIEENLIEDFEDKIYGEIREGLRDLEGYISFEDKAIRNKISELLRLCRITD